MNIKLSEKTEWLGKQTVDIAYHLHKELGPGLLESVYKRFFAEELRNRNLSFEMEYPVNLTYKNLKVESAFRLDLIIENQVIVELKAQDLFHPVWESQILSYLKLTGMHLGYLINFHNPLIKHGINRYVK